MKQIIIISILFDGVKSVLYNIELMFGPSSDILMAGEFSDEILNAFLAILQRSENVDPSTFFYMNRGKNVLRWTLLQANKSAKDCSQFLNVQITCEVIKKIHQKLFVV